ncbi:GATOR complex protein MIOS-like [Haliotis rufescens]|uniref:GATOR complex protein MIOS-like n=1 Tax=Haliotis rufescens TaxID=6454 RepID=UPI001EAFD4ED|nr:GATOR complex protein MIOS-like [Haliotis rufescens]
MSSTKFDVLWSPSAADQFIKYGTSLDLYQVEKRRPGHTYRGTAISDDFCAVHVATNSEINLIKCVAWYPRPEPRNLLAVGHTNGKVVLTSFGNNEDELIGKEFLHNAKHSRQCSYLAWNPEETHLLAEGFSERYRNDPCIVIWDVFASAGTDMSTSTERSRISTNSEWGVVSKPLFEIGSGSGDTSTSFCWFVSESKTFVTGVNNRHMRVYDLRDLTRPHLQNQHKGVLGLCVDPLSDKQLASFGENQVSVWDLRSFEKPVLTLPENKSVVKISWCPTRSGMLSVLCKDNNVVQLYDIRHSVFGADVMEPALVERNIQPCKDSVISSFTWHPTHENRLLSVTSSGEVRDTVILERIPMMWSPSFHLTWACGKKTVDCVQTDLSRQHVDISTRMYNRVKMGYGLDSEMSSLDSVGPAIDYESHLHGLWKWLFSIKDYLNESEPSSILKNSGIGIRGILQVEDSEASKNVFKSWIGVDSMVNQGRNVNQFVSRERSVVLQLCGWGREDDKFGSLKSLLENLQEKGFYEKAAALALFNLRLKQSLEILSHGASRSQDHANLNAVAMALAGYSDQKSTLWQKTCSSLRDQLEDPYLRAMFAFLTGDRQNYKDVLESDMAVEDLVAFACIYLPDPRLMYFIDKLTNDLKSAGNLDGIMLTGMTAEGLDLLENYIDATSDVQTAALALVCSFPHAIAQDERIQTWIDSYRKLLDRWRLWHHRAKFDILYHKSDPGQRIPSQVFVGCNFCGKSITSTSTMIARSTGYRTHVGRAAAYKPRVTCCPSCRKSLPRCALCLTNLGTASGTGVGELKGHPSTVKMSMFDDWFTWCQSCRHGGHSSHIQNWFKDHSECPVTDCSCKCMKIDSLGRVMGRESTAMVLVPAT